MNNFEFIDGSIALLDLVNPLWEGLNTHQKINSNYYSDKFINDKNIKVKLDLIKCKENNLYVGYCITTVNKDSIGEIDALFVDKKYREYGLGDTLMGRSLEWLNSNHVKTKIIGAAITKMY